MLKDYWMRVHELWVEYMFPPKDSDSTWSNTLWCRWCAHPGGVYWYSSGNDPDMHCKNCGDYLG